MKLEVTVCNVCKSVDRPTTAYTISKDGSSSAVDLCAEHAAPLEQVLAAGPAVPITSRVTPAAARRPAKAASTPTTLVRERGRAAARRSTPILTLDEIAARKAAKTS